MGQPFWENDIENHPYNHYEPRDFSVEFRPVWKEPLGETDWPTDDRVSLLRKYIIEREANSFLCGAKHPLFCLCVNDIFEAWGDEAIVIWSYRSLNDSVNSLLRTSFPWSEWEMRRIQHKMWRAASEHFARRPPALRLEFSDMWNESARQTAIDRIIETLNLQPTKQQVENAVNSYRM
jgi:hypothetical protein